LDPVQSALTKAGLAAGALVVIALRISRSSRPPSWFGVRLPPLLASAGFVLAYLAWMLASDALIHWRGPWDFMPWQQAPVIASALRVLAVCILGPTVEEFIFRGMLFSWLKERIHIAFVILLTAVSWALLHWSYSWPVIAVIAIDGILLGLARWRTRSVFTPVAMHMLYNLYAIW
jgi:membrane protease YdiL (CAAX protease family)